MGLFNKLKQMVGITGIKIDLILPKNSYQQGETISGTVKITGGPEAKTANKLIVKLVETFPEITVKTTQVPAEPQPQDANESQDSEAVSEPANEIKTETLTSRTAIRQEVILAQQFQILPQAALEYPISLSLPAQAAVNGPSQEWHLKTELDIAGAFDAADTDAITVVPHEDVQVVRDFICKGAGYPTNCLLRVEAMAPSGERLSNRVYYL